MLNEIGNTYYYGFVQYSRLFVVVVSCKGQVKSPDTSLISILFAKMVLFGPLLTKHANKEVMVKSRSIALLE